MIKNNKKGFTLVELLAVMAVLAIIALIAVPVVTDSVRKSKNKSMTSSAQMYIRAVEQAILESRIDSEERFYPNICYVKGKIIDCDGKEIKVKINGKIPTDGIIKYKEEQIELAFITYGNDVYKMNEDNTFSLNNDERLFKEKPDLFDGTLTPIKYDGENWVITHSYDPNWFDYDKQEWANAVILRSDVAKNFGETVILEGENPDVLAMYVWIPRYEYKIEGQYGKGGTSTTNPGEIEVNFISTTQTNPTNGYRVHPAFTFGDRELSGIWVGKFELSHVTLSSSTTSNNLGCTNEMCSNSSGLRILPDKVTLRYNNVSNYFYGIKSMEMEGNVFGIDSSLTDSHMIKNSEWGAVTYLSQSKYGKYGNNDYEGANKEVYINNSSGMYTGRSGGSYPGNTAINTVYTSQTSTTQYLTYGFYTYDGYLLNYNTNIKTTTRDLKTVASTTGNITGIYDMSGGTWEYVMGVFANSSNELWSGYNESTNSGFTGKVGESGTDYNGVSWPDSKYYDVYKAYSGTTINSLTACNSGICYGHAIDETAGWNGDYKGLPGAVTPWFRRGGINNSTVGIFAYNPVGGHAANHTATRSVLTLADS